MNFEFPFFLQLKIFSFLSVKQIGKLASISKNWKEIVDSVFNHIASDISMGKELIPIPCQNTVDFEKFPKIQYIKNNIAGPNVNQEMIDGNSFYKCSVGCNCFPICGLSFDCTCAEAMNNSYPYNNQKRLLKGRIKHQRIDDSEYNEYGNKDIEISEEEKSKEIPIFECGKDCCCTLACENRVLQLGITILLELFKSKEKGWGLRPLQQVYEGQFICEYVGEIITTEEAKKRQQEYDRIGSNYLLVVREFSPSGKVLRTNIDSTVFANVARCINHSCDPNLRTQLVRVDSMIPRVGLFAARDINSMEEFTFDYGRNSQENAAGKYSCHCGAPNCSGLLPFNPFV